MRETIRMQAAGGSRRLFGMRRLDAAVGSVEISAGIDGLMSALQRNLKPRRAAVQKAEGALQGGAPS
jgi:hypothetical protein